MKSRLIEKDPDAGKDGSQEEKWTTEYKMVDGNTNSVLMSLSPVWKMVKDSEAWNSAVHGAADSWTRIISKTTTIANFSTNFMECLPCLLHHIQCLTKYAKSCIWEEQFHSYFAVEET